MRVVQPLQPELGQLVIAAIEIDLRSRDEMIQLLRGLQYLYTQDNIRKKVFRLLEENIEPETNRETGCPGMSLWNIFVMGVSGWI